MHIGEAQRMISTVSGRYNIVRQIIILITPMQGFKYNVDETSTHKIHHITCNGGELCGVKCEWFKDN